jgi:hypothetical protein
VFIGIGYGLLSVGALVILRFVKGGSFSPWTDFVSDLGVGSRVIEGIFAAYMLVFAAALPPYFRLLSRRYTARGAPPSVGTAAFVFGCAACAAMVPTGLFPLDPSRPTAFAVHVVSGIAMFTLIGVALILYGMAALRAARTPLHLGVLSVLLAASSIAFSALYTRESIIGGPHAAPTYLVQWVFFGLLTVWCVTHGVHTLRD